MGIRVTILEGPINLKEEDGWGCHREDKWKTTHKETRDTEIQSGSLNGDEMEKPKWGWFPIHPSIHPWRVLNDGNSCDGASPAANVAAVTFRPPNLDLITNPSEVVNYVIS